MSFTLSVPSSPAEAIQRPSGLNRRQFIPFVWPLYVNIQPFLLMSHSCGIENKFQNKVFVRKKTDKEYELSLQGSYPTGSGFFYLPLDPSFLFTKEKLLTLIFVSKEPDATNSPYGWKSRLRMLDLWPVNVLTTEKIRIMYTHQKDENNKVSSHNLGTICTNLNVSAIIKF